MFPSSSFVSPMPLAQADTQRDYHPREGEYHNDALQDLIYMTPRLEAAPVKLIIDNGPQFISKIFEHLSEILGITLVKTVVYRPQANRTKRVNCDLVQMIANYINDQHDTWDQFLRKFAYAIRAVVNKTMGKIPAALFLGRKLITPFKKLMVSD
ncbi:transposon Ty3-I Gag-Pol polyprotein [Trichonephila clavipes]|nr:transposon Ty3-I Gag-Pol polyprotein [Trichonephila clavipes]